MRNDVEMPDVYLKVCRQTLLIVGIDGLFSVHLVFERLMLLFLKKISFVPGHDSGVRNHSVYVSVQVRQTSQSLAQV